MKFTNKQMTAFELDKFLMPHIPVGMELHIRRSPCSDETMIIIADYSGKIYLRKTYCMQRVSVEALVDIIKLHEILDSPLMKALG